MATNKDYYEILGVNKNSSGDDIKKAYRNLAREHHPDMVGESDKEAAERRFKEINEAYQVLSDPQKRKMYDQFGHAGVGGAGTGGQGPFGQGFGGNWGPFNYTYSSDQNPFGDVNPFDIFEDFFGFRGFSGRRTPKKGKNLYYELMISFKDAVCGIEKAINVESGKINVKIPAGVEDGVEIKYAGKGMEGPDGAPPGDLFLTIRYSLPKNFQKYNNFLVFSREVNMALAALGGEILVDVVDPAQKTGIGSVKIKIPAGTQHGTQIRLKGKGMPYLRDARRGDIIVQILVSIPRNLNKNQKRVLEEYLKV